MTAAVILCIAGAISTVIYVKEKIRAYSVKSVMLKSLVSCLFIGTGLAAAAYSGAGVYGALIVGGLVCGIMGDIWLDLKYVYRDDEEQYTFAGFKAFFAGHILYMVALIIRWADLSRPGFIIIPIIIGAVSGVITGLSGPFMKLEYGKYKTIVMIYGGDLFAMVAMSASLAIRHGFAEPALNLMTTGGVLFAVSDLILSGTYFGTGKDRPVDLILNYATYYPAQFIVALTLLFV